MNAYQVIKRANTLGIRLYLEDGKLAFEAAKSVLEPNFKAEIVQHKADIVELLQLGVDPCGGIAPLNWGKFEQQLPLSYSQQRFWLKEQITPDTGDNNLPLAFELCGDFTHNAFEYALNVLIQRHEILRTNYVLVDDGSRQFVRAYAEQRFPLIDIQSLSGIAQQSRVDDELKLECETSFNLMFDLMLRAKVFQLTSDRYLVLMTMHHIASDGWSAKILIDELSMLYSQFRATNDPSQVALLDQNGSSQIIQYLDYAYWQHLNKSPVRREEQLAFWRDKLINLPLIHNLPIDHVRPAVLSSQGGHYLDYLPIESCQALKSMANQHSATLFMVLYGLLSVLMSRLSGDDDIVIGTPIANREQAELSGVVGFFLNTLILRADLSTDPSFTELLAQCRRYIVDAYEYQEMSFDELVNDIQPSRSLSYSPLFQVMLVLQNNPRGELDFSGVDYQPVTIERHLAEFDLTLEVTETQQGLTLDWNYADDLFEEATIERFSQSFVALINGILKAPDTRVSALPMLCAEGSQRLLTQWNNTAHNYPKNQPIGTLFSAQAQRSPNAIAIIDGDIQFSYKALESVSNRLAHYLLSEGVIHQQVVALYMEPSALTIITVLAVLKTGAAYITLPPDYPENRLNAMLSDCQAKVVIHDKLNDIALDTKLLKTLALDLAFIQEELTASAYSNALPELDSLPEVAYLIYTSGSTGQPKGVKGTHQGLVNRVSWLAKQYPFTQDEVLCLKTSLGFVDHVAEIFQPLLEGLPLVIIPTKVVQSLDAFIAILTQYKISRITLVPSLLKFMVTAENSHAFNCLKMIISSGETLPYSLAVQVNQLLPRTTLLNIYGSSEVGADITYYAIDGKGTYQEVLKYFTDNTATNVLPDKQHEEFSHPLNAQSLSEKFSIESIPDAPVALEDYFTFIHEQVIPNTTNVSSSKFVGHMASRLPGFMEELSGLITRLNQNVVKVETSRSLTFIERQTLAMLHELFYELPRDFYRYNGQNPAHVFGAITSGGSIANVNALWCARNNALIRQGVSQHDINTLGFNQCLSRLGFLNYVFLGTKLMHYSMRKAANFFGIGEQGIVYVPQDKEQRMSVLALKRIIEECKKDNVLIVAIVGIAGATETGTVDPLDEIGDCAKQSNIHFHVDAAWGGAFKFSERHKHRIAGMEKADSITFCPHKQLYLPQGISLCLFKNTHYLSTIATHTHYQAVSGGFDSGQYTIEGSRAPNCLYLHASLHILAKQGYGALIDKSMQNVSYITQQINEHDAFELIGTPELNIVNYRYIPMVLRNKPLDERNDEDQQVISCATELIQCKQFELERTFVSKTRLNIDGYEKEPLCVFRMVLFNPLTSTDDLQHVLYDQVSIANQHVEMEQKNVLSDYSQIVGPFIEISDDLDKQCSVPIGYPIANSATYVLDAHRNLVPIGVVGELYVSGDGLSPGYVNSEEHTSKVFVDCPYDKNHNTMFATGDFVRRKANGSLEFVGRKDAQVKIRGCRVELQDIETTLGNLHGIKEAIVIAEPAKDRLKAYVVTTKAIAQNDSAAISAWQNKLRDECQKELPPFMHPAIFQVLSEFPLLPNGKLNKRALSELTLATDDNLIITLTFLEEIIAVHWRELLDKPNIGSKDNFFEIGGHSLLAVQLTNKLKRAGFELNTHTIFTHPTLAELARYLDKDKDKDKTILQHNLTDENAKTSVLPNFHWFAERRDLNHWNDSCLLNVDSQFSAKVLKQAFSLLLQHHDGLRRVWHQTEGQWLQVCRTYTQLHNWWKYKDIAHYSREEQHQFIESQCNEIQHSLNITTQPFMLVMFNTGENARLFIGLHHLLIDVYSYQILFEDFTQLCDQLVKEEVTQSLAPTASIQTLALSYQNHCTHPLVAEEYDRWRTINWDNYRPLPEETDKTQLALDVGYSQLKTASASLTIEETHRFEMLPKQLNISLEDIILTALVLAYQEWAGEPALCLCSVNHGRLSLAENTPDLSRTIGWLANYSLHYYQLDKNMPLLESVKQIQVQRESLLWKDANFSLLKYMHPDTQIRELMANIPEPQLDQNFIPKHQQENEERYAGFRFAEEGFGDNEAPLGAGFRPYSRVYFDDDSQALTVQWSYCASRFTEQTMSHFTQRNMYFIRKLVHALSSSNRQKKGVNHV